MKYKMIIENVISAIQNGEYKKGSRLPSIREMVAKHKVNKSTIIKAYEEMEQKHIIYSVPKSGYYVTGNLKSNLVSNEIIDFSRVIPDEKLLPFREFNHCVNRAVDIYKSELFTYGNSQGLTSLREALSKLFAENDIYTKAKDICVTSGAHQGLSILINMDFPNKKKKVLIEQPTYVEIQNMLKVSKSAFLTVKRDAGGLDLAEVERIFKEEDIKFFYTMSRFHNPLGTHLSLKQKKRLLELAEKYNVYIVEDDYLADIKTEGLNLPLYYYDVNNKVIYLRSFSKSFMPGIRIGCVILMDELIEEFLKVKRSYDLNTSMLMQGALELYITNGMYNTHIRKINNVYKKKHKVFIGQLKFLDKEYMYVEPADISLVFWFNLKDNVDSTTITQKLLEQGVKISDGKQYFIDNNTNGFRLSILPLSHSEIRHGINIIYDTIRT